jgi:hypothetical protein
MIVGRRRALAPARLARPRGSYPGWMRRGRELRATERVWRRLAQPAGHDRHGGADEETG